MVLSPAFEKALDDEIEARVNERITKVLEIISKNYKIKYSRLLSDLAIVEAEMSSSAINCHGITKSGQRCQRPGKYNGYCKNHASQRPEVRNTGGGGRARSPPATNQHTHTLPPLFMKGCPACENNACKKSLRI